MRERCAHVTTPVLNLDNGPENHSRHIHFMHRVVAFARRYRLRVQLAYYPPSHSKHNPIERCWGILEQHWKGGLLESVAAVLGFAETMTWHGRRPLVAPVARDYQRGVRLTEEEMAAVEAHLARLPGLERWSVHIEGPALAYRDM